MKTKSFKFNFVQAKKSASRYRLEAGRKVFSILFYLTVIICVSHSQNITNTLGTGGLFKVQENSNTIFTLNQFTGASFLGSLNLPLMAPGSQTGAIFRGGSSFIHSYCAPGTNGQNIFMGIMCGNFSMSGSSSYQASYNTAIGFYSMHALTTGYYNSAFGSGTLELNTTGSLNSAFGYGSLGRNISGTRNSAFGEYSLSENSTGSNNSAFGNYSLDQNSTGSYNTAFGVSALQNNTTASYNSAFGHNSIALNGTGTYNSAFGEYSLYGNSSGSYNSTLGGYSLYQNTSGNYNTAIGYYSGNYITTGSNNITIGFWANVPSPTASNQVRIGNTSITYAGIQVPWTITSDLRLKSNISSSKLGLDFISALRPVSYTRINDEKKKTEFGFIAQDVEQVLNRFGEHNSGMVSVDCDGTYSLRYNDLIAPLVKSVQELSEGLLREKAENDRLKKEVEELKSVEVKVKEIEAQLLKINQSNGNKMVEK